MTTTNPLSGILTPKIRQIAYVVFALAGVVSGVLAIVLEGVPDWLDKYNQVLAYLTIAFGLTAASNPTGEISGDEGPQHLAE